MNTAVMNRFLIFVLLFSVGGGAVAQALAQNASAPAATAPAPGGGLRETIEREIRKAQQDNGTGQSLATRTVAFTVDTTGTDAVIDVQ